MKSPSVFLSYAENDRSFTLGFGRELEQLGVTVVDGQDISGPGETWAVLLRKAIEDADAVVLIAPETGNAGANSAFFEAGAAHSLGKLVFAVVPDNDRSRLENLPSNMINLAVFNPAGRPALSADVIARELRALVPQAA